MRILLAIFLLCLLLSGCISQSVHCPAAFPAPEKINSERLLFDLKILSSNEMQGRKTGTQGSEAARDFIKQQFLALNLQAFFNSEKISTYEFPFEFGSLTTKTGINVIGFKPGTDKTNDYIVVSAHYDHLGKEGNKVFNGADDNASGVASMISLARYLSTRTTHHSIIFVATDAEEIGIFGAKAFIKHPPVAIQQIKLNINLDMVAQGGKKQRLYLSGLRANPQLKEITDQAMLQSSVCLKAGHEGRKKYGSSVQNVVNWNSSSDHSVFAEADIPYLYFGVDPHRYYHQTTDTFESIDPVFYTAATETILNTFLLIDQSDLSFTVD